MAVQLEQPRPHFTTYYPRMKASGRLDTKLELDKRYVVSV